MKKIINITTQVVSLLVVCIGLVYVFSVTIKTFPKVWFVINSQFFFAIITLFVGSVAYFIYIQQKIDYKRKIANLILQEIRYAEQRIREAKERNSIYMLADRLLPTNSWNTNIHLFISVLEENQVDTISRFYSRAEFLDNLIKDIANEKAFPKNLTQGNPIIIQPSMPFQQNNHQGIVAPQPSQIQLEISGPTLAELQLKNVSSTIELIYNSPAVDSLRKIATK